MMIYDCDDYTHAYYQREHNVGMDRNLPINVRVHQIVSPIWFTNFFHEFLSVWAVGKGNKLLIGPKQIFFSQFDSWKRNQNKYSLKKFVDSEFEICETIWWIHQRTRANLNTLLSNHPLTQLHLLERRKIPFKIAFNCNLKYQNGISKSCWITLERYS